MDLCISASNRLIRTPFGILKKMAELQIHPYYYKNFFICK